MKRTVVAFILGAFLVAAPVAAKVVTVTNPMAADLDGGGHNVVNVTNFVSATGAQIGGAGVTAMENVLIDSYASPTVFVSDFVCTVDPSIAPGVDRNAGSMCRRVNGQHAELWFKVGPLATDWQRVAP